MQGIPDIVNDPLFWERGVCLPNDAAFGLFPTFYFTFKGIGDAPDIVVDVTPESYLYQDPDNDYCFGNILIFIFIFSYIYFG